MINIYSNDLIYCRNDCLSILIIKMILKSILTLTQVSKKLSLASFFYIILILYYYIITLYFIFILYFIIHFLLYMIF